MDTNPKQGRNRLDGFLPDLHAIAVFLAVADGGGMIAGARQLGLTQSAVSKSVATLEAGFGHTLFDRSQRPLRLTRAGQILHRHAARLLQDAVGLSSLLAVTENEALPSLRIGIVESFTATGPAFVKAIQSMARDVRISCSLTPELAAGLRQWELDIVISSDPMEEEEGLTRMTILREPFIVVSPSEYPPTSSIASLQHLATILPFIRYTKRSKIGRAIEQHYERLKLDGVTGLEFDTSSSLLNMVAAGLGWAITTPLCLLQGQPFHSGLTASLLPSVPTRQIFLIHRAGDVERPARQVFDLATNLLRRLLYERYATFAPKLLERLEFGDG